jgi:large subunit ribosomal protein L33
VPKGRTEKFVLGCPDCGSENYVTSKNRQNNPDKLTLSKYCRFCRKHTTHTEKRLKR